MTDLNETQIEAVNGAFLNPIINVILIITEEIIDNINPPGIDLNGDGKIGF